ncbi:MAG: XrtA/PEP-CTERM system exopolysaccharide export protein [Pseudomonadota bacterium]
MHVRKSLRIAVGGILAALLAHLLTACAPGPANTVVPPAAVAAETDNAGNYLIGPGDQLNIFVWRNPDVSVNVPVRPDGKVSTPLVEDMQAAGKTPSQLARDIEAVLGEFIKNPVVTVIVQGFVGDFGEQIRIVGQVAQPQSLPYRQNLTLLDVMIEVGGLTDLAAGRRAKIIRRTSGDLIEIKVRPDLLLDNGDLTANVRMLPGDVIIIPEARF